MRGSTCAPCSTGSTLCRSVRPPVLPLCFCAFLAFGVVLVLVGANEASLAAQLGLDLARSGLLASSLALGLGAGVVIAGPLFDRYPRRPLFVASTLLAAVALLG